MIEIDFRLGGNSGEFRGSGWHEPEPDGTWTDGPVSTLIIPHDGASHDYECRFHAIPFRYGTVVTAQTVVIAVASEVVFRFRMVEGDAYAFTIPARLVGSADRFEISITCSHAMAPRDAGHGHDVRCLGLMLGSISLTPVPARDTRLVPRDAPIGQLGREPRVCAVTMVFNEAEYLPIWLKHYAQQVGIENCYVIDHGSTDGSTQDLGGANVLRIPRSPYDPHKQSEFNSRFCSSLLTWFEWVVYSDVDELLLPDPLVAKSITDYCKYSLPDVVTAIGLNVIHRAGLEPAFDPARPITQQRPYVFGCSSMCKPLLFRRPITWAPGSHSSDAPLAFGHLYMFHLRWFDLPSGVRRLHKTRDMAWARTDAGGHQRVDDAELVASFEGFARLIPDDDVEFALDSPPLHDFLAKVRRSVIGREADVYKIDLEIWPDRLWKLPERFVGLF